MIPEGKPGERRYGQWAGSPKGQPENLTNCAYEVCGQFLFRQCNRKRGHGPNGEFCKQHAKRYPIMCDECGKNPSDPPSKLCPGCEAYKEHQS